MKRTLTASTLMLIVLPLILLGLGQGSGVPTDPEIRAILSQVDSSPFWTPRPHFSISGPASPARINPNPATA